MYWSWELWEWTAGRWRGRPVFAAMFPNSLQMCVSVCVYVYLRVYAWTLISLLCSSQDCFLPSLKWVVGAFQHLSPLQRKMRRRSGRRMEESFFLQQDRKELKRINTQTYTYAQTYTVWHLRKPRCVSTNLLPQGNRSTSSSTSPVEPHVLL